MDLRVKDVKVHVVCTEPPPPAYYAPIVGRGNKRYTGVLRIITEEGLEGHAFVGTAVTYWDSPRRIVPLVETVRPFLVGQNALDREWLWHHLRQMAPRWDLNDPTIMAVDVALWDLAAKAANVPLHRLLGSYRDRLPVYASAPYHPEVEATVDEALACREQGMKGYKLHHAVHDLPKVVKVCTAVRKAVGDEMSLMFDGGCRYGFQDALSIGRTLDELGFRWFEDPMRPEALDSLADLSQRLDTAIAMSDVREFSFASAACVISKGAARILRTDPAKDGITGMKKLAHLTEAHHLSVEYHDGGNALLDVALLHVALSVRNTTFFPWVLHTRQDPFGLVEDVRRDSDGNVRAPEGAGLGVEIDWRALERFTEAVL